MNQLSLSLSLSLSLFLFASREKTPRLGEEASERKSCFNKEPSTDPRNSVPALRMAFLEIKRKILLQKITDWKHVTIDKRRNNHPPEP